MAIGLASDAEDGYSVFYVCRVRVLSTLREEVRSSAGNFVMRRKVGAE